MRLLLQVTSGSLKCRVSTSSCSLSLFSTAVPFYVAISFSQAQIRYRQKKNAKINVTFLWELQKKKIGSFLTQRPQKIKYNGKFEEQGRNKMCLLNR